MARYDIGDIYVKKPDGSVEYAHVSWLERNSRKFDLKTGLPIREDGKVVDRSLPTTDGDPSVKPSL